MLESIIDFVSPEKHGLLVVVRFSSRSSMGSRRAEVGKLGVEG